MEGLAYELVARNCTAIRWVMQQVMLPKYSSCRKDLVASCNMVGVSDDVVLRWWSRVLTTCDTGNRVGLSNDTSQLTKSW